MEDKFTLSFSSKYNLIDNEIEAVIILTNIILTPIFHATEYPCYFEGISKNMITEREVNLWFLKQEGE